jgi:putative polyhydroxyalkanoate system protein
MVLVSIFFLSAFLGADARRWAGGWTPRCLVSRRRYYATQEARREQRGFFAMPRAKIVSCLPARSGAARAQLALFQLSHHITTKESSMADIHIVQEHTLTPKKAREAAQKVADKMAEEYDLECTWEGDVLRFERSGVSGSLTLAKKQAQMDLKLGFLFSAFSSKIESKISENMQKVFGSKA